MLPLHYRVSKIDGHQQAGLGLLSSGWLLTAEVGIIPGKFLRWEGFCGGGFYFKGTAGLAFPEKWGGSYGEQGQIAQRPRLLSVSQI